MFFADDAKEGGDEQTVRHRRLGISWHVTAVLGQERLARLGKARPGIDPHRRHDRARLGRERQRPAPLARQGWEWQGVARRR